MRYQFIFFLIICALVSACRPDSTLFALIDPAQSNVHFSNHITETDTFNILFYEYMYNGAGIGMGDFNNDGLEDLFVGGNLVDNALYLNKGDFEFEDVSAEAGIQSKGYWASGIAVVDINADGWQDIYVCNTTNKKEYWRTNQLYINQGLNEKGIPTFKDQAEEYGLADNSYSVNAAFFDYDNDHDLDVIIIVNEMGDTRYHSQFRDPNQRTFFQRVDRLYRNDPSDKGHPVFTDVSEEAGIQLPGFSLGVNISDINKDGWKDIYISNDFLSDEIIYMNQKDGTFKDAAKDLLKHTSHSAMGNDVVDLNNDGYDEIIALDMLPEGNYRQKRLLGETNYTMYLNNERFGYSYQYVRNTLQLNNGIDSTDAPKYSEISLFSGISATDWSWTPLVADFDHDGFRDIIVTNGFPRDVTDHDFIDYKADAQTYASAQMMLDQIPSIKLPNYAFKNNGDMTFSDLTTEWGLSAPSYSNGAAYADLDNDGDLDFVVNNINDSLFIYRNEANHQTEDFAYLAIDLKGHPSNPDGLGTQITIETDSGTLYHEHSVYRGYLSSYSKNILIPLAEKDTLSRITIAWPDQSISELREVPSNQLLQVDYNSMARSTSDDQGSEIAALFEKNSTIELGHVEDDYIDYNVQPLLPHKLSQYGPSLTVGDINGDQLDDVYIGGSTFFNGYFVLQKENGVFEIDSLLINDPRAEESGALIFDAEGDGDNDIFIASGSYELNEGDTALQDRLIINNNGTLEIAESALPEYYSNATNIRGADFDRDGDIDLFICGRVVTGDYPKAANAYLLENQSDGSSPRFVFSAAIPGLEGIGMITDAIWTDYNNDQRLDIILVGEFESIIFFKNTGDGFQREVQEGVSAQRGFWNSISGGDLDNDGDTDYIVGNLGTNTYVDISSQYPYRIYVNDFDKNGSSDALPFAFFKDEEGGYKEYPFVSRMDFAKEINEIRKRLPSYSLYAQADVNTLITKETMKETEVYEVNFPYSSILWNEDGVFRLEALPPEAQLAPVFGTIILDFDQNGFQDILLTGNDFGNELVFGRMDALNGLLLLNHGGGSFQVIKSKKSGIYTPGDGKSLALIQWDRQLSVISGANKGNIELHTIQTDLDNFELQQNDQSITYTVDNVQYVREVFLNSGFLSQGSGRVVVPQNATSITVTNSVGKTRKLDRTE